MIIAKDCFKHEIHYQNKRDKTENGILFARDRMPDREIMLRMCIPNV